MGVQEQTKRGVRRNNQEDTDELIGWSANIFSLVSLIFLVLS